MESVKDLYLQKAAKRRAISYWIGFGGVGCCILALALWVVIRIAVNHEVFTGDVLGIPMELLIVTAAAVVFIIVAVIFRIAAANAAKKARRIAEAEALAAVEEDDEPEAEAVLAEEAEEAEAVSEPVEEPAEAVAEEDAAIEEAAKAAAEETVKEVVEEADEAAEAEEAADEAIEEVVEAVEEKTADEVVEETVEEIAEEDGEADEEETVPERQGRIAAARAALLQKAEKTFSDEVYQKIKNADESIDNGVQKAKKSAKLIAPAAIAFFAIGAAVATSVCKSRSARERAKARNSFYRWLG